MNKWIATVLLITSPLSTIPVRAEASATTGGSDGGTNIDKVTREPVDFVKSGRRVRINPRKFEGIYQALKPKLDAIEYKIPGLGAELEKALDLSWEVTDQTYEPRNAGEEKPIIQTKTHVLISAALLRTMNPEQIQKAFFHEMVRRFVQNHPIVAANGMNIPLNGENESSRYYGGYVSGWPSGASKELAEIEARIRRVERTKAAVDPLVEALTADLYYEYDRPSLDLAEIINKTMAKGLGFDGSPYISRQQLIRYAQETYHLKEKYDQLCKSAPPLEVIEKIRIEELDPKVATRMLNDLTKFSRTSTLYWGGQKPKTGLFAPAGYAADAVNTSPKLGHLKLFLFYMETALNGKFDGTEQHTRSMSRNERITYMLAACGQITRDDIDLMTSPTADDKPTEDKSTPSLKEALRQLGMLDPAAANEDRKISSVTGLKPLAGDPARSESSAETDGSSMVARP